MRIGSLMKLIIIGGTTRSEHRVSSKVAHWDSSYFLNSESRWSGQRSSRPVLRIHTYYDNPL